MHIDLRNIWRPGIDYLQTDLLSYDYWQDAALFKLFDPSHGEADLVSVVSNDSQQTSNIN